MRPIKDNPCNGCVAPRRYPGCHSHCTDYIIAKAFHEAELAVEYQQKSITDYGKSIARKNVDKAEKRRKRARGNQWLHR